MYLSAVPKQVLVGTFDVFEEPSLMTTDPQVIEEIEKCVDGRFDHFSRVLARDPHAVYDEMRARCPITRSDLYGGFWVFSSYDDVYEAYHRTDIFSSGHAFIPPNPGVERPWIPLMIDPPDHKKYRRILDPLFSPAKVRELADQINDLATELVDSIAERGECDFVEDFAVRLPGGIFLMLMGLPLSNLSGFLDWVHTTIHGIETDDPAEMERARAAAGQSIYSYFTSVVEARKQNPQDDVISNLMSAVVREEDGTTRSLELMEILDICFLILNAGLDTVAGVLGMTIQYLAENPDARADLLSRMDADGRLPDAATEELLRWTAPVLPGRQITQDVMFKGHQLKKGDQVILVAPAACRDAQQFADAEILDFDRKDNKHIAFGTGIHRCLGSHLARFEFRTALEAWHRRFPDYEVKPGESVPGHVTHVTGLEHLPLLVYPSVPVS